MSYSRITINGMDLNDYLSSMGVNSGGYSSYSNGGGGYSTASISGFSMGGGGVSIGRISASGGNSVVTAMMTSEGSFGVSAGGAYYDSILYKGNEIEVNKDGHKTRYKGRKFNFSGGKLCIDGMPVTENDDRITFDTRKKKEEPKLANDSEQKPAPSSNALIQNALNQAPAAPLAEVKLSAEESFVKDCSKFLQDYLNSFNGKKSHTSTVEDMKLTAEEMKLLDKYLDPITHEIMNKPVELNEQAYDLSTVVKFENRIDPCTRLEFQPSHLQDCRKLVNDFEAAIKQIEANRKAAAQKNEANAEVIAPGGPRM